MGEPRTQESLTFWFYAWRRIMCLGDCRPLDLQGQIFIGSRSFEWGIDVGYCLDSRVSEPE